MPVLGGDRRPAQVTALRLLLDALGPGALGEAAEPRAATDAGHLVHAGAASATFTSPASSASSGTGSR